MSTLVGNNGDDYAGENCEKTDEVRRAMRLGKSGARRQEQGRRCRRKGHD
ncbi:hypothetical protein CULCOIPH002_17930 [Corynebacterium ulcerans]|uniref:Uncharacterized protein n=1 Tax=Corynebacterium ulcerans TaxID=65058 RepID=A0ABD0BK13_CORUL|nr:hypothetical protein CULCOIPH001_12740 [Corynebacterium ulcerans]GJJ36881.1 hypothetical protein CULCOIPH002_17930 [Corynebacterium ulcerans]GJJ37439.1 hypothetical protein CULCOIPH003_00700 [Corynebacterium ulcerans]GJJ40787.1 hypothetical protein CULCOIPH004_11980 [Corynebacterium ulcerans]GJJ43155.1 hypothetical protein CULCOIPH005_13440 [Corynebacterium ulcerans]